MEFSAAAIAQMLQGELEGNPDVMVSDISRIQEGRPGTLTFLSNPKYEEFIYSTEASIVIVNQDFKAQQALPKSLTLLRVKDSYSALAALLQQYEAAQPRPKGISDKADIHPSVKLGKDIFVGAYVSIGENCVIENGVEIHPNSVIEHSSNIGSGTVVRSNVTIYRRTSIGKDCIIHAGVVIGGDGFGFAPKGSGYDKIPQIGNVILEDGVEIGANTCVDRATIGSTIIRKGVKLDNLIQIAHNVDIGENTVIAAQTGIAGSTTLGKQVMIGGQVGMIGHIQIADEVKIAAQSGIGRSIEEVGSIVQGSPAISNRDFKRAYANFVKLPQLRDRLIQLEKKVENGAS